MDRVGRAVGGFLILATAAAMILAGVAPQVDSSTYNAQPLYFAAVYVFAAGVLVWRLCCIGRRSRSGVKVAR